MLVQIWFKGALEMFQDSKSKTTKTTLSNYKTFYH